jgi:hypothetical protein
MNVTLIVLDGKQKDKAIPLPPPSIFVIGRDKRCHLRPHSPLVSRFHCAITQWVGKVLVRDLKSANGTFVNNEKVQGERAVRDGDTLRVGNVLFVFRIDSANTADMDARQMKWLIEAAEQLSPVDPASDTHYGECMGKSAAGLSAGQYLHDMLRRQPRMPAPMLRPLS